LHLSCNRAVPGSSPGAGSHVFTRLTSGGVNRPGFVKSYVGGWSMPKQYPIEFRQRALRLVLEAGERAQYETEWAAIVAVSSRLG
jgi:hypothetical protein